MPQLKGLQFGSGTLLAAPQPSSGNPAPNPTPLTVGVIQDVKLTFGADIKELFGQNQWAVDTAVGKRSIKGSFDFAQMSNELLSQLFTGDAVAAGVVATIENEAGSIPATPFSITVAEAADFVADYGVTDATTGQPYTAVASGPTTGEYTVDVTTGVYTFAAADTLKTVLISYTYSDAANGTTLVASNQPMGFGPIIALNIVFAYEGGGVGFYLPNVRLGKIDLTTKLDDYTMMSTDFSGFAGAAGTPFSSYQAW